MTSESVPSKKDQSLTNNKRQHIEIHQSMFAIVNGNVEQKDNCCCCCCCCCCCSHGISCPDDSACGTWCDFISIVSTLRRRSVLYFGESKPLQNFIVTNKPGILCSTIFLGHTKSWIPIEQIARFTDAVAAQLRRNS